MVTLHQQATSSTTIGLDVNKRKCIIAEEEFSRLVAGMICFEPCGKRICLRESIRLGYPYSSTTNGCFYGLTGIYSGLGASSGTGILGAVGYSTYVQAPNIQGKYAGYFLGNAHVSSNMSASQVYTTSDMRLKENVIALREIESGQATLDKIMAMKVAQIGGGMPIGAFVANKKLMQDLVSRFVNFLSAGLRSIMLKL